MNAVLHCRKHVDRTVLHRHIVACLDAVSRVAVDIQCSFPLEFCVPLYHETCFLFCSCTVGECIFRVFLHADVHPLAILDVDGSPIGIGQLQSA